MAIDIHSAISLANFSCNFFSSHPGSAEKAGRTDPYFPDFCKSHRKGVRRQNIIGRKNATGKNKGRNSGKI